MKRRAKQGGAGTSGGEPASTRAEPPRPGRAAALPPREPRLERGTVEHYLDPLLYDHEYRRRRADVNYYRALVGGRLVPLGPRPPSVLELGCGSGRLLLPLLRDGHAVTGVDLSTPMLRRCQERLDRLPPSLRARATLVRGDFRELRLGRRFSLVLCPFNAMMHLYTRQDLEAFLAVVRAHLAPGGRFAFDVMNPDLEWLMRDPGHRWARTRFKDPRDGRTYYYSTNHVYDRVTQVNHIRLYYDEAPAAAPARRRGAAPAEAAEGGDPTRLPPIAAGRRRRPAPASDLAGGDLTRDRTPDKAGIAPLPPTVRSRVVQLSQRQLFPAELMDLLHYNGFSVEAREGGFVGEPFEAESYSQVCRCSIGRRSRR